MTRIDHDNAADETFRPHGRSSVTLRVQPRPRGNSVYVVYGDGLDAPEVLVHTRVTEDLRLATLEAVPHETIGVLLGRPCRDDYGIYVVVENAMTAEYGEYVGTPGAVRISAIGRSTLQRRAAHRHPTLEPVGWWHSHPFGMPRYSSVDLDEQATYPRPYHVGIVVAAELLDDQSSHAVQRSDPYGVYVGPAATLLAKRDRVRDYAVRERVVEPLGREAPRPAAGAPPVASARWPAGAAPESPARWPAPASASPSARLSEPSWPEPLARAAAAPPVPVPPRPPTGDPAGISERVLLAVGVVIAVSFVAVAAWLVLATPGSRSQAPNRIGSDSRSITCQPGGGKGLRLGLGAPGDLAIANPAIASAEVLGSIVAITCKQAGRTTLTIDGRDVGVNVQPRTASRGPGR